MNDKFEYEIYFCGISKNCIHFIEKNILFIEEFIKKNDQLKIYGIFVDSDSVDGTKEFLKSFTKDKSYFKYIDLDNLEKISENRINRISISRNRCLEEINEQRTTDKIIYIPIDLDINLFKYQNIDELLCLIETNISKELNSAIFPFSLPYYYDIFALRASGWLSINSQFWVTRLKKYLKIGSFFYNYFFIFRNQISIDKFNKLKINIKSAFGGIGIYYINDFNQKYNYKTSSTNPFDVSEHIIFNSKFNKLNILSNWNIPAPNQHLEFKNLKLNQKISYFFRSLKHDIENIL